MNPALAGRCFPSDFLCGQNDGFHLGWSFRRHPSGSSEGRRIWYSVLDMFLGKTAGTIGETSVIAILIGAIVLLWFEVIDLRIPGSYMLSFAVCTLLFGGHGLDFGFLLRRALRRRPDARSLLYGDGLCDLSHYQKRTDRLRHRSWHSDGQFSVYLGSAAEGVSYAIIIGNLLVPVIEKVTEPTAFGREPFWKRGKKA